MAWANTGSIAQIKDDGQKIVFRAIIRDSTTGAWSLTKESKFPVLAHDGMKWEHIQFSGIGIDLAAVDNTGAVYIYTLVGALGKMLLAPSNINMSETPRSDLDAVVGMHWLAAYPTEFKVSELSTTANADGILTACEGALHITSFENW